MTAREQFLHSVGRLDALEDTHLHEYFTPTEAIARLASPESEAVLAVGAKGIGKSAAYRFLSEIEDHPDVVVGLRPDKYTLHLPRKDLHYSTSAKQFRQDLIVEALRAITEDEEELEYSVEKNDWKAARKVVSNYLETIKGFAGRFGGVSVLGCGFTINEPASQVLVGLEADKDIDQAFEVLESICESGVTVRIIVDDPEQVFSASQGWTRTWLADLRWQPFGFLGIYRI